MRAPLQLARSISGRLVFACIVLCSGTCSSPGVPGDAATEAGGDGGPMIDGGERTDAGQDAGPPALPRWREVPGTDGCLEVAEHATLVLPVLNIVPCAGEPDCREVRPDWPAPTPPSRRRFVLHDAERWPSGGVIAFTREVGEHEESFVARDDGTIEAAFRTPAGSATYTCLLGEVAVSESRIVIGLLRASGGGADVEPPIILSGPRADPTEMAVLRAFSPGEVSSAPQGLEATDEVLALEFPSGDIWRIEPDGSGGPVGGASLGEGESHIDAVVGDRIFYTTGAGTTSGRDIRVSGPAGGGTLVAPPGEGAVMLRTDGRDMIWQRLAEPAPSISWDIIELWTAPFATVGPVEGRRVVALPPGWPNPFLSFGDGLVLTPEADGSATVLPIDGGPPGRLVDREGDGVDTTLMYVGPDEIGFAIGASRLWPSHRTFRWVRR